MTDETVAQTLAAEAAKAAAEGVVASTIPSPPPPQGQNVLPIWDALAQLLGWRRPPFVEMGPVEVSETPVDTVMLMIRCGVDHVDMKLVAKEMTENGLRYVYVCPKCGKGGVADREFPFPQYRPRPLIQRAADPWRNPPNGRPKGRH